MLSDPRWRPSENFCWKGHGSGDFTVKALDYQIEEHSQAVKVAAKLSPEEQVRPLLRLAQSFLDRHDATRTPDTYDLSSALDPLRKAESILRNQIHPDSSSNISPPSNESYVQFASTLSVLALALLHQSRYPGFKSRMDEAYLKADEALKLLPKISGDGRTVQISSRALLVLAAKVDGMDTGNLQTQEWLFQLADAPTAQPVPDDISPALATKDLRTFILIQQLCADFENRASYPEPQLNEVYIVDVLDAMTRCPADLIPIWFTKLLFLYYLTYLGGTWRYLDLMIRLARKALQIAETRNLPNQHIYISNLSVFLFCIFDAYSDLACLDEAEALSLKALNNTPTEDKTRPLQLANRAAFAYGRYEVSRKESDLNKAIDLAQQSVNHTPPEGAFLNRRQIELSLYLYARYQLRGTTEDLETALEHATDSWNSLRTPERLLSRSRALLARLLASSFEISHDDDELNYALKFATNAVDAIYSSSDREYDLAQVKFLAYKSSKQLIDLDAIIENYENHVLRGSRHDSYNRWHAISGYRTALVARYEETSSPADLDKIVTNDREFLSCLSPSHPDYMEAINRLFWSVSTRYDKGRHQGDLSLAVTLKNEIVQLTPRDSAAHADHLRELIYLLFTRGSEDDMVKVAHLEKDLLVQLKPPPVHDCRDVIPKTNHPSVSDETIDITLTLLYLTPKSHPDRPNRLWRAAEACHDRYNIDKSKTDLLKAVDLEQELLEITPETSLEFTRRACRLATTFILYSALDPASKRARLDNAMSLFQQAASSSGLAVDRAAAAISWARVSFAHEHPSEMEAFSTAMKLLPQLASPGLDLRSRYRNLVSQTGAFSSEAAACCIRHNDLHQAVMMLEQARSVFFSELLKLRPPIDSLRDCEATHILWAIMSSVAKQLASNANMDPRTPLTSEALDYQIRRQRELSEEWDKHVKDVQDIPGYENFLQGHRFQNLAVAAAHGPIVLLFVGLVCCEAIVLMSPNTVKHLRLETITAGDVRRLQIDREKTLKFTGRGMRADRHAGKNATRRFNEEAIWKNLLRQIWLGIAKPVLDSIGYKKPDNAAYSTGLPRVWWCATGDLASLPIHASGIYGGLDECCVGDIVVSSYIQTIASLLSSPDTSTEPKILAIGQADTLGSTPLPQTMNELKSIQDLGGSTVTCLDGPRATVQSVSSEITKCTLLHLACHGVQSTEDPLTSSILLADGRLEVARTLESSLPNAQLVFLSACQTAAGDRNLPDEAMHIAGAMLFAGFKGAIATMWSIDDSDGASVAKDVYSHLLRNPGKVDTREAAAALHAAVQKLRKTQVSFARWIPFIHMGV